MGMRLVGLLLALVCAGSIGFCVGAGKPERSISDVTPSVKVRPPYARVPALGVFDWAGRKAYKWDRDSKLLHVSPGNRDFGLDGLSSRWSFRFISGNGKVIRAFFADTAHPFSVRVLGKVKRPITCGAPIEPGAWKTDCPAAISVARSNGLDSWLAQHPGFVVGYSGNRFELCANKTDGPLWLISCTAPSPNGGRKRDRILLMISASDGHLISKH